MKENKISILIVDDIPDNITILKNLLSANYKLKAALNGKKAIELAKSNPKPDLVLLDIMMPDMDGYAVCEALKSNDDTKDISIIFQTSNNAPLDEKKAFELGASDYITKPFNPEVVKSRIENTVRIIEEKKKLQEQINELHNSSTTPKTEAEIEELISSGETSSQEFKSTLRYNLHTHKNEARIENQCLKSVVGFLNTKGGYLFVGIDDDGNALGLSSDRFKNHDKLLLHWFSLLKKTIGTDLINLIDSEVVGYKEKNILMVACRPANRPVFFSRDDEEHFYVRVGNSTQSLKPSEMLAYIDNHYGTKR